MTLFARCGFTPVSTVLRKSVRFFIINILLIIIKLPKLKSGKWSRQMFSFCNFRALEAPSMNQKPGKGNFRELKSKKIPLEACSLGPSFRKSVNIYPRSAPVCSSIAFLDGLRMDKTSISALIQSIERSLHLIYKNRFSIKQWKSTC